MSWSQGQVIDLVEKGLPPLREFESSDVVALALAAKPGEKPPATSTIRNAMAIYERDGRVESLRASETSLHRWRRVLSSESEIVAARGDDLARLDIAKELLALATAMHTSASRIMNAIERGLS